METQRCKDQDRERPCGDNGQEGVWREELGSLPGHSLLMYLGHCLFLSEPPPAMVRGKKQGGAICPPCLADAFVTFAEPGKCAT